MDSQKNGVMHGRVLTVLNTLRGISEAVTASDVIYAQETRVEFLLSAIESSAAELHELFVGKMDKDTSKESGNTSFWEVVCLKLLLLITTLSQHKLGLNSSTHPCARSIKKFSQ